MPQRLVSGKGFARRFSSSDLINIHGKENKSERARMNGWYAKYSHVYTSSFFNLNLQGNNNAGGQPGADMIITAGKLEGAQAWQE